MKDRFEQGCFRVPFVVALTVGCLCWFGLAVPAFAGEKPGSMTAKPKDKDIADCTQCHTCAKPTPERACLPPCTRVQAAIAEMARKKAPQGVLLLDMLKGETEGVDRFGPVPFDHTGHADWAEIAGGCTSCHHYTPEGVTHPSCKSCHPLELKRPDIRKPSLKGAYHRQCMGCHRQWSHNTRCDACHMKRVGEDRGIRNAKEALGSMTKPIPEPDTTIYQTRSKPTPGTQAIFRHKEHSHRFGIKCALCHQGDSCARCHEERKEGVKPIRPAKDRHQDCADCHKVDVVKGGKCERCHWNEGQPKPPPFDHAETGWVLNRYHKDRSCRACHKTAPFAKLDRNCNTCHSDWEPDTFNHAVTGQVLDENHVEIDCADCHTDRKFDVKPRCDECHDADEGFVFPNKRPGPTK
ncbi:MAG: cytochrome c3 family protein [Phycisphaerae bacterium]|nr:cytochrome c3 family protein [Phycisphaerae bacterium]